MKVSQELNVYEIDGVKTDIHKQLLIVKSHWNFTDRVILMFGGREITVLSSELQKAIKNATNF
jgi:hypothetical protein